jgi:dipeptidyl aminopeptidase/acylaminoacyl peptidase
MNRAPIWSPTGDSLLYSSNRSGRDAVYVRRTDGSLAERVVVPAGNAPMMWATSWSRHGPITFTRYDPGASWNLYELRAGVPVPLVNTPGVETRCAVSPDGRWLAFDSNRSGQTRLHVMDMGTRELFALPTAGGMDPHWASAAGRLYFRTPANDFFEVTPVAGARPTEWPIRHLFRTGFPDGYDVDAQGRRLLCCLKSYLGQPEEVAVLVNLKAATAPAPR